MSAAPLPLPGRHADGRAIVKLHLKHQTAYENQILTGGRFAALLCVG
jgi:hypothetical protein